MMRQRFMQEIYWQLTGIRWRWWMPDFVWLRLLRLFCLMNRGREFYAFRPEWIMRALSSDVKPLDF